MVIFTLLRNKCLTGIRMTIRGYKRKDITYGVMGIIMPYPLTLLCSSIIRPICHVLNFHLPSYVLTSLRPNFHVLHDFNFHLRSYVLTSLRPKCHVLHDYNLHLPSYVLTSIRPICHFSCASLPFTLIRSHAHTANSIWHILHVPYISSIYRRPYTNIHPKRQIKFKCVQEGLAS